jgi:putative transposase
VLTCLDAQYPKHITYQLAYHVVWCPNYRKKLLACKLATFIEQEIRRIGFANTWRIGALNVQEDHGHLLLRAPANVSASQIAHTMQGATACKVFQRFPALQAISLGRYCFDRMTCKDPFDFLGYMSGQIIADSLKSKRNAICGW